MKIGDRCFVHGYVDEIRKDLIAAQSLNRRFVGCELDEYYYNQALSRFNAETSQLTMFNLFGGNI